MVVRKVSKGNNGDVLLELMTTRKQSLLLLGGHGGNTYASFNMGWNKVSQLTKYGEEGAQM
jgi:GTPase involved in cell partitioning and DNA repair